MRASPGAVPGIRRPARRRVLVLGFLGLVVSQTPLSNRLKLGDLHGQSPPGMTAPLQIEHYDIHDLLSKPKMRASEVVQTIISTVDPPSWNHDGLNHGTIEILNGVRLAIRATRANHAG